LAFRADMLLDRQAVGYRATLCRCGASRNKPFCDNSHRDLPFAASGEPATIDTPALAVRNGPLQIQSLRNGPLRVIGNVEICTGTGRTVKRTTGEFLCRCGQSAYKPFCDGSHTRVGFVAP
jgi:CDGSH-type Zn-finger protein